MNQIEIDDILSTTVVYNDFFGYSNDYKFLNYRIDYLEEIANKYKENLNISNIEDKNTICLKNEGHSFLREFIYRFESCISIEKLIYPLVNHDVISYEIIDLSNDSEKVILSREEIYENSEKIEITLCNSRVNHIKLKVKSKKNIWPKISEIKIIKSV
ncbi:hypothetical protein R0131_15325 [Clostridium sp. AL.422]|uniref:hypothetical protein n=1 Tax=Clostridium TaxID=1485 RepID=UPI00293DD093|nr:MULTISPECIES: hypothetical protein [unclassified Clostridium]MDV4152198.1 hypothetical protein [Clostridium sp. AL.422]